MSLAVSKTLRVYLLADRVGFSRTILLWRGLVGHLVTWFVWRDAQLTNSLRYSLIQGQIKNCNGYVTTSTLVFGLLSLIIKISMTDARMETMENYDTGVT